MPKKHMEACLTPVIITENLNKTTMRYYLAHVRMDIMNKKIKGT